MCQGLSTHKVNGTVTVQFRGCQTFQGSNDADNPTLRTIVCNGTDPVNQYTLVHELGHIFDNRSTLPNQELGALFQAVEGTYNGNCPEFLRNERADLDEDGKGDPIIDFTADAPGFFGSSCTRIAGYVNLAADPSDQELNVVMGRINVGTTTRWARGERGWGSGPDNVFTNFQQHPPDFPIFQDDDDLTRIDETAADMFLNWAYRRVTNNPPSIAFQDSDQVPGNWEGFKNRSWIGNSSGSDDNSFPGDARFRWVTIVMQQIFSEKDW